MPVATVKSHLQRALKVLRARMQQRPIRGGAQRPAN
jgi:DNA-directed RNA polymerase specialized sigma24 family protein